MATESESDLKNIERNRKDRKIDRIRYRKKDRMRERNNRY